MNAVDFEDIDDREMEDLQRSCPLGICDGSGTLTNRHGDERPCQCQLQDEEDDLG